MTFLSSLLFREPRIFYFWVEPVILLPSTPTALFVLRGDPRSLFKNEFAKSSTSEIPFYKFILTNELFFVFFLLWYGLFGCFRVSRSKINDKKRAGKVNDSAHDGRNNFRSVLFARQGDLSALKPTYLTSNGRSERTKTNLIHFKQGSVWIVTSIILSCHPHPLFLCVPKNNKRRWNT